MVDEPLLAVRLVHVHGDEGGQREEIPYCCFERGLSCGVFGRIACKRMRRGGGALTNDEFVEGGESGIRAAEQTGRQGQPKAHAAATIHSQVEIVVLRA